MSRTKRTSSVIFIEQKCASVSRLPAGFVTHLVFRYSSIRRSFVDGWNVTPSIRCSGNCTG